MYIKEISNKNNSYRQESEVLVRTRAIVREVIEKIDRKSTEKKLSKSNLLISDVNVIISIVVDLVSICECCVTIFDKILESVKIILEIIRRPRVLNILIEFLRAKFDLNNTFKIAKLKDKLKNKNDVLKTYCGTQSSLFK